MKKYSLPILALLLVLISCSQGPSSSEARNRDFTEYQNMAAILRSVGGLQVIGNGGPETRIYMRGLSTITLETQPLFVINGMPVGRGYSLVSDIIPANVDKVKVYRGLTAVTLWGENANHGAIQIETKTNL